MNITPTMRAAALVALADDPLAQKLIEAFWSQPQIEESSASGKIIYSVGGTRYPDARSAYVACIGHLGRKLATTARDSGHFSPVEGADG